MKERPLSQHVAEMHSLSEMLIPYTYPAVDYDDEADVLPLKCRHICVDGTDVVVSLNKSDHKKYVLWSLQIQGSFVPFLPFNLVCKIARKFLGSEKLSYVDFLKNNKKIYCWTLKFKNGVPVVVKKSRSETFEGFEYRLMQHGSAGHNET
jgi:hypothetical protein